MFIDPYRFGNAPPANGTLVTPENTWDAEIGDMTGWTTTLGNPRVRGPGNAAQGVNHYDGGTSASSFCYQRIDLSNFPAITNTQIDAGDVDVYASWWAGTFYQPPNNDQPQLHLVFRDGSLSEISTYSSGYKDPIGVPGLFRWDAQIDLTDLPPLTRYIDVTLEMKRNTGSNNDAAFDDIQISLLT